MLGFTALFASSESNKVELWPMPSILKESTTPLSSPRSKSCRDSVELISRVSVPNVLLLCWEAAPHVISMFSQWSASEYASEYVVLVLSFEKPSRLPAMHWDSAFRNIPKKMHRHSKYGPSLYNNSEIIPTSVPEYGFTHPFGLKARS